MKKRVSVIGLTGMSVFLKVNEFNQKGQTATSDIFLTQVGGKGFNQAVALNRFNCDVRYLTVLGEDSFGDECEKILKKEKIKSKIFRVAQKTAFASIVTDSHGENQVVEYKGASEFLTVAQVDEFKSEIENSGALLVQMEYSLAALKRAIVIAHNVGIPVVLNPAPANEIDDETMEMVDYCIPNEHEYKNISNCSLAKNLIITRGANGCDLVVKQNTTHFAANKVVAVDTTGAGDVFCGVFTAGLVKGKTVEQSIAMAQKASALKVGRRGVYSVIPYENEI